MNAKFLYSAISTSINYINYISIHDLATAHPCSVVPCVLNFSVAEQVRYLIFFIPIFSSYFVSYMS